MKFFLLSFLFVFFLMTSIKASAQDKKKLKEVEIQWEAVPGAQSYELEIVGKEGVVKTLSSATSIFQFKLLPGKYRVRGRVLDKEATGGAWSNFSDFKVSSSSPVKTEVAAAQIYADKKSHKAKAKIDWTLDSSSKKYLVVVKDKSQKVVFSNKFDSNSAEIDLPPGEYAYTVSSLSADNVEFESGKETPLNVLRPQLEKPSIKGEIVSGDRIDFKIEDSTKISGRLEYGRFFENSWTVVQELKDLNSSWVIPKKELAPGKYRLTYWNYGDDWTESEKNQVEFVVKPTAEQLLESQKILQSFVR